MSLHGAVRAYSTAVPKLKTYSIGLLGYGVVGSHTAKLLLPASSGPFRDASSTLTRRLPANTALDITSIARRKVSPIAELPKAVVGSDALKVATDPDVDILVEVMGGLLPAGEAIAAALDLGKPVVTANKYLLATHPELFALARDKRVPLFFEASVAGGIPVIEFLRTHLAAATVSQITGVLNGSTNYILEKLNSGQPLDSAMDEARQLGYLEADPRDDVEGLDAGYKITLLHSIAFGSVKVAERSIAGIVGLVAPPQGKKWRLLCLATPMSASVAPELVGPDSPFWNLPGPTNALYFETDVGNYWLTGPGAGGMPTAGSVVGDVIRAVDWLEGGGKMRKSDLEAQVPWYPNLVP